MTDIELPPPPRQVRLSGFAWFLRTLLWLLVPVVGLGLTWLAGTNSRRWGRIQQSDLGKHGLLTTGTVTAHQHHKAKVRYRYGVGAKNLQGEAELPPGSDVPDTGKLLSIHYFIASPHRSLFVAPGTSSPAGTDTDHLATVLESTRERWELHYAFEVAGKRHAGHSWRSTPPPESAWPAPGSAIRILCDQRDPARHENEVDEPAIVLRMKPQFYVWVIPIAIILLVGAVAFEAFLRRQVRFFAAANSARAEITSNEEARDYWFQWVTLATAILTLGRMPFLSYHSVRYRLHCVGKNVDRSVFVPVNAARAWQPGEQVMALVNDAEGQHRLWCELSSWVRASPVSPAHRSRERHRGSESPRSKG